jgi:hypothetical protein
MLKRFASLALMMALVCTVGGTSVLADTPPRTDARAESLSQPTTAGKNEAKPNEKYADRSNQANRRHQKR